MSVEERKYDEQQVGSTQTKIEDRLVSLSDSMSDARTATVNLTLLGLLQREAEKPGIVRVYCDQKTGSIVGRIGSIVIAENAIYQLHPNSVDSCNNPETMQTIADKLVGQIESHIEPGLGGFYQYETFSFKRLSVDQFDDFTDTLKQEWLKESGNVRLERCDEKDHYPFAGEIGRGETYTHKEKTHAQLAADAKKGRDIFNGISRKN